MNKRLYIIGGKGGVGRSTVAAALGMRLAREGKRTLLVELDTAGNLGTLLGDSPAAYEPVQTESGLWIANLNPEEAQREYGLMKLKSVAAYRLVFENPVMGKMLNMIPGLRELLLLGKLWFMEQERRPDGSPKWDVIVLDAPATGHSVTLFQLPRVILNLMGSGPMARDASAILKMLTDRETTALWIVTLAEELPVSECLELAAVNESQLQIPLEGIWVNQIWEGLPPDESLIDEIGNLGGGAAWLGVKSALQYTRNRMLSQAHWMGALREGIDSPVGTLPFLEEGVTVKNLEHLGGCLKWSRQGVGSETVDAAD